MLKNTIQIEFSKLKKYTPIKIIVLIYMVLLPVFMYVASKFLQNMLFPALYPPMSGKTPPKIWEFGEIWKFTFYSGSYFHILIGIIVILVISNEFTFKTAKQNIIDGMTKKEVILGKMSLILFLSIIITIYTSLVAFIFGLINSGESSSIYQYSHFLFVFIFQAFCYYSLALFFVVLIRNATMSIIVYAVFPMVDIFTGWIIPKSIYAFTPLNVFSSLTPSPIRSSIIALEEKQNKVEILDLNLSYLFLVAITYLIVFYFISYINLKRRDI